MFSTIGKSSMIEMEKNEEWDSFLSSEIPIVLQAGASWCAPCKTLKPALKETASKFEGKVQYVYMDVDNFPEISQMLDLQSIPKTFMIYKGDIVDEFVGVPQDPKKLQEFFTKAEAMTDEKAQEAQAGKFTSFDTDQSTEGTVIFQEGGFIVKALNEGTGDLCPKGSKVKVHYTGKLTSGKVFDSSLTRGQPLDFTVGVGQVIKGWDVGICQLKKGQKAILTCPADYAYGARDIPGVIPANSELIFEVELIDFKPSSTGGSVHGGG